MIYQTLNCRGSVVSRAVNLFHDFSTCAGARAHVFVVARFARASHQRSFVTRRDLQSERVLAAGKGISQNLTNLLSLLRGISELANQPTSSRICSLPVLRFRNYIAATMRLAIQFRVSNSSSIACTVNSGMGGRRGGQHARGADQSSRVLVRAFEVKYNRSG